MLLLPLKAPIYFDVQHALAAWLDSDQEVSFTSSSNNSDDPPMVLPKPAFTSAQCRAELLRIQSLRKCLCDSITKSNAHKSALEESALEDSMEYHAILLEFEQRGFPTVDQEENGIDLKWNAAFSPQHETHHTLVWDRVCCLWNIAALYSQKMRTLQENYGDDRDAQKQMIQFSQTAASLLNILQQLVTNGDDDFATVEMSKPMITFWLKLFLAEAQSTICKIADQTKHTILASLNASAHQLFNEALACAQDPRLQSEVPKQASEWGAYCKSQSMLASAKADYHQAVVCRQASQWGPELTRLKTCWKKLQDAQQFLQAAKDDPALVSIVRQVDTYLPFVENRYRQAHADNTTVYQEEVPASLPDVPPKQLAKLNATTGGGGGGLPEPMTHPKVKLFANL